MSCCGGARTQIGIRIAGPDAPAPPGAAVFEYIGRTALTAMGGATGTRYRFEHPGARLTVDWRDRASLDQLPMLKQVA